MTFTYDKLWGYQNKENEKLIELLEGLANEGDVEVQYLLGRKYYEGEIVEKDYEKCYYWIEMAANKGYAPAQRTFAICHQQGIGTPIDFQEARCWFEKSAKQGYLRAMAELGIFLVIDKYRFLDYREGVYWLEKAALKGEALAQFYLAKMYEEGYAGTDKKKSLYWYEKAASKSNEYASLMLSSKYLGGLGVRKDFNKSKYWLSKIDKDNMPANMEKAVLALELSLKVLSTINVFSLFNVHINGDKVRLKHRRKFKLCKKIAEAGCADAQYNLGWMFENGECVKKDYEKAIYWYGKAVEQSHAASQYRLAYMYENGYGVEVDNEKAFKLYQLSAKQHNHNALISLARFYENGICVEKSIKTAMEIYYNLRLEKCNNPEIYYRLGYLYCHHYATRSAYIKAKECFTKAISMGYKCEYALEMVDKKLEINNKENEFKKYILSAKNENEVIANLEYVIQEYDFEDTSKTYLKSLILDFYRKKQKETISSNEDYSTIVVEMSKVLENELKTKLLDKYLNYLNKNNVEVTNKYLLNKDNIIKTIEFEQFTLGKLRKIIGLKENLLSNISESVNIVKGKTCDKDKNKVFCLDKTMLEFLKREFFNMKYFNGSADEEIIDYMAGLTLYIEDFNENLRTPSAHHNKTMESHVVEEMLEYILFGRKLLPSFLEKIK